MRSTVAGYFLLASLVGMGAAGAAECPPGALGVSRTIVVDPNEHVRLGSMQYGESLPLNDHEVVLTFDDGPLPPYTNRILETLASECVKATFFIVGRMARAYPAMVRRVHDEGHTVANHSQNHPFTFHKMSVDHAPRARAANLAGYARRWTGDAGNAAGRSQSGELRHRAFRRSGQDRVGANVRAPGHRSAASELAEPNRLCVARACQRLACPGRIQFQVFASIPGRPGGTTCQGRVSPHARREEAFDNGAG